MIAWAVSGQSLYDSSQLSPHGIINRRGIVMKIFVLVAALGALAVPAMANTQSTARRHACSVQHYYSSISGWKRGTAHDPADESLKATTYADGSGSCHPLALRRWIQIASQVFTGDENEGNLENEGNGGSFSVPGFRGTWRHLKTVQVPHTCGSGVPHTPLMSTLYGWFSLRVFDLNGGLVDTGTLKLRLAC
jgi:hypothetical protein